MHPPPAAVVRGPAPPHDPLHALAAQPGGEVWAVGDAWLVRVDPATDDLDHYLLPDAVDHGAYMAPAAVVLDAEDHPWLLRSGWFGPIETGLGAEDTTDPTLIVRTPADGATYLTTGETVVDLACPGEPASTTCTGLSKVGVFGNFYVPTPDGSALDRRPDLEREFLGYAVDAAGNSTLLVNDFAMVPACRGVGVTAAPGLGRHPTSGDDVLLNYGRGFGGDDRMCGRANLAGEGGHDQLFGSDGPNLLSGGRGNDRLLGGAGPDQLRGGPGFDVCIGGRGADTFEDCERVRQE